MAALGAMGNVLSIHGEVSMYYAKIENGIVVNTIVAEADFAAEHGLVPLQDRAGVGWSYVDGVFISPPSLEPDVLSTPASPNKEDLLAQLLAIQAQIEALK